MATIKKAKGHKRTIAQKLHRQWRRLERKNDAQVIADLLEVSKPTIDKALIYGAVHQQKIVDGITNFFADRLIKEKEDADHLADLSVQKPDEATTQSTQS
jgi:hypothetical protein